MAIPQITAYLESTLSTISLPPHSVMEVSQEDAAIEFKSLARLFQYVYYDAFFERRFNIQVPALTSSEVATLQTFWTNRKGRVEPFKWVSPVNDTIYFVRFAMESLTFTQLTHTHWSCALMFSEAHPLEIELDSSGGP